MRIPGRRYEMRSRSAAKSLATGAVGLGAMLAQRLATNLRGQGIRAASTFATSLGLANARPGKYVSDRLAYPTPTTVEVQQEDAPPILSEQHDAQPRHRGSDARHRHGRR